MRVIDACLSVQKNSLKKQTIKMIWEQNLFLNCPFEALFEPIANIEIVDRDPYLNYFLYGKDQPVHNLKSTIKKTVYGLLSTNYRYFDDKSVQAVAYDHDYWHHSKHHFVIHSCVDFYSPELKNLEVFVPVRVLQILIDKETHKFIKPTTGIHIRRTDNSKSIDKSSTELFVKRIEASLKKNNDQLFYLATDDEKEEALLLSNFGEHILTQKNKDLDRNSPKGIQDALVDLYSLSKTERIWGSYWSSFSKTAAALHKIPLEIII